MKFDPFAQMGKAWETWQEMTNDAFTRTAAFYAEVDKLEAKNIERAESAFAEVAKLTKETMVYNAQLGAEFRKQTLEGFQRAATAFAPSASAT
jgi:hypothetical protein